MVDPISGGKPPSRPLVAAGPSPRPIEAGNLPAPLRQVAGGPVPLAADRLEARGLVRDMATRPPVDSARVETLRTALLAGQYRLDLGRLADAMLNDLRAPAAPPLKGS